MAYLFYIVSKADRSIYGVVGMDRMHGQVFLRYKVIYPYTQVNNVVLIIAARTVFEDQEDRYDYGKEIQIPRL